MVDNLDDQASSAQPQQGFGRLLRRIRVSRSVSQEELAHRLAVPRTTVDDWESGRVVPDRSLIVHQLRDTLRLPNRTVDSLLRWAGHPLLSSEEVESFNGHPSPRSATVRPPITETPPNGRPMRFSRMRRLTAWSRAEILALASVVVAAVACLAAFLVVPEFRRRIGWDASPATIPRTADLPEGLTQPFGTPADNLEETLYVDRGATQDAFGGQLRISVDRILCDPSRCLVYATVWSPGYEGEPIEGEAVGHDVTYRTHDTFQVRVMGAHEGYATFSVFRIPRGAPTATPEPVYDFRYTQGSLLELPDCDSVLLKGRVVGQGGEPVNNATVRLRFQDQAVYAQSGAGRTAGEFSFTPLNPAMYHEPIVFAIDIVRSEIDPSPLSDYLLIEFPGCDIAGQFDDIVFAFQG
jgi:transcriptional regulator with XRE-family HTH domain